MFSLSYAQKMERETVNRDLQLISKIILNIEKLVILNISEFSNVEESSIYLILIIIWHLSILWYG